MAIQATPAVKLTPSATKTPTPQNFLDLSQMSYYRNEMPHQITNAIEGRYGSQMLDVFMAKKGMKIALESDVAQWQEENRLVQIAYGVTRVGDVFTSADHTFRIGEVLTTWNSNGAVLFNGIITAVTQNTFTASAGNTGIAGWGALATTNLTCHTGTNEHKKGTATDLTSLNTTYETFTARPTIVKELVRDNMSNLAQVSWLKTSTSDGGTGWLWYNLNENNCEMRFRNAREQSQFESEEWTNDALALGYQGRKGLLKMIGEGNIYSGLVSTRVDAEDIVDRLNKQGQLPRNTIYGNMALNFGLDAFLSSQNINGQQYGEFDNAENMELNLSFNGYKLGGYQFNYGSLQYLNNVTGHGSRVGITKINGFLIPNASQTVKDTLTGKSSQKPMLHVLHRSYGAENRDYKQVIRNWDNGTLKTDEIEHEFLSEQAIALIGRNNTILFKNA